jgi:predicted O-linked N-acetylglucosamine transferase (SPINDLY family)
MAHRLGGGYSFTRLKSQSDSHFGKWHNVRIAAALAADRGRRADLRATLREGMLGSPLCDGAAFTRGLEQAYEGLVREARR